MKSAARWSIRQLAEFRSAKPCSSQPDRSLWRRWLKQMAQFWFAPVVEADEPKVWHSCDRAGNIWWSAYDPSTGTTIHEVAETEMRRWLEQRHQLSHLYREDQARTTR